MAIAGIIDVIVRIENMRNVLFTDVKEFLSNEVNRVFIAVIIVGCAVCIMLYTHNREMKKTNMQILKSIEKLEKKVDFRYFNITRSLSDIHKVEIDTKNGKIIPIFNIDN